MNNEISCLICKSSQLKNIKWQDYNILKCLKCDFVFCNEFVDKEELGDSSPVDKEGTNMMARSFYETQKSIFIC